MMNMLFCSWRVFGLSDAYIVHSWGALWSSDAYVILQLESVWVKWCICYFSFRKYWGQVMHMSFYN